jgi:nucleoside-diphosphate-sugar epimerase
MSTQSKSSLQRKLVLVIGATGGQGGSVISRLLADGSYRLRGITRNSQSKSAQALTEKGVEMVTADLNDMESLEMAFKVLRPRIPIPINHSYISQD